MRLLKLNTPTLALVFAVAAGALIAAFAYVPANVLASVFPKFLDSFFFPAFGLTILCMPSSFDFQGSGAMLFTWVAYFFAFLQLYLIFLVGIGVYRHFHKKHREDLPGT